MNAAAMLDATLDRMHEHERRTQQWRYVEKVNTVAEWAVGAADALAEGSLWADLERAETTLCELVDAATDPDLIGALETAMASLRAARDGADQAYRWLTEVGSNTLDDLWWLANEAGLPDCEPT